MVLTFRTGGRDGWDGGDFLNSLDQLSLDLKDDQKEKAKSYRKQTQIDQF